MGCQAGLGSSLKGGFCRSKRAFTSSRLEWKVFRLALALVDSWFCVPPRVPILGTRGYSVWELRETWLALTDGTPSQHNVLSSLG